MFLHSPILKNIWEWMCLPIRPFWFCWSFLQSEHPFLTQMIIFREILVCFRITCYQHFASRSFLSKQRGCWNPCSFFIWIFKIFFYNLENLCRCLCFTVAVWIQKMEFWKSLIKSSLHCNNFHTLHLSVIRGF